MGKPYTQELEKIPDTYDWAKETPIDDLIEFVKRSKDTPLYVIGSGGSFSATTFVSLLHQHIGRIARCVTPLEFLEFENIDSNCSVLIVTAGGNNTDILSAFDKAVEINPKNLGIVCASVNNKLTKKASQIKNVLVHAVKLPTRKDGFLATNSLVATLVWTCRAYIHVSSLSYPLPNINDLVFQEQTELEFEEKIFHQLENFVNCKTVVCLYDNWGKTAATDTESKLVEAGLANVQLADYRNFAHGRHNWLDKNKEDSCLIALVNPNCGELAKKTLKLIPEYIPKIALSTNYEGPVGAISLLIQILYIVKFFGNIRKIDPGRPGVADFGRKIYHLPIPKTNSNSFSKFEEIAIRKKFGHCNTNDPETKIRVKHLQRFLKEISKTKFGAIVFDYDGTLCDAEHRLTHPSKEISKKLIELLKNDIAVGIATGRGKSVREALQKVIPEKYWPKVLIGYYNCSDIGYLDDNNAPSKEPTYDPSLLDMIEFLIKHDIIVKENITSRQKQITLENIDFDARFLIQKIKSLNIEKLKDIKIVESTHSVDLLSTNVSKLDLIKWIKDKISNQLEILCIGDKGKWPGNDFELLSQNFSLSVDETSDNENTCWNLTMNNIGEKGVLDYFSFGTISKKQLIFNKIGEIT